MGNVRPGALAGVGVDALERILLPSREDITYYLLLVNLADMQAYRAPGLVLPLPPKASATSCSTLRSAPDKDLDGTWAEVGVVMHK